MGKEKSLNDLPGVMTFGPIQNNLMAKLDHMHVVRIEEVTKWGHPFANNDIYQIYVLAVDGPKCVVNVINWLFEHNVIRDRFTGPTIKFLERTLEAKESEEKR